MNSRVIDDSHEEKVVFAQRSRRLDSFVLLLYFASCGMAAAWLFTEAETSTAGLTLAATLFIVVTAAVFRVLRIRYLSPELIVAIGDQLRFNGSIWPGYSATLYRAEIAGFSWDDCGEGDIDEGLLIIKVFGDVVDRHRGRPIWTSFGNDAIRYSYASGDATLPQLTDALNAWLFEAKDTRSATHSSE